MALWGQWLFWNGTHWARDTSLEHMTRARVYLNSRASELALWAERKAEEGALDEKAVRKLKEWAKSESRTLRHASTIAAVVNLARSNRASVAAPESFDADPWLLGTPGGTVDLRTGQLRPARRKDLIVRQASVAPVFEPPTLWLQFFYEIFDGDSELIDFV